MLPLFPAGFDTSRLGRSQPEGGGRGNGKVGRPDRGGAFAETGSSQFDQPGNRSHPKGWSPAASTAENRADVVQDRVGEVEQHLEGADPEDADRETPGEPFGGGQSPQN